MNHYLEKLNSDQLDGLAKLCFELAKASLVVSLLPIQTDSGNLAFLIIKVIAGIFWGLVFIYLALVILKRKNEVKYEP